MMDTVGIFKGNVTPIWQQLAFETKLGFLEKIRFLYPRRSERNKGPIEPSPGIITGGVTRTDGIKIKI